MSRIQRITEKLTAALQPTALTVRNISHTHAGHAGAGVESHVSITITSAAFTGLTRLQQHQRVNALLADEFAGGLHAAAINTKSE